LPFIQLWIYIRSIAIILGIFMSIRAVENSSTQTFDLLDRSKIPVEVKEALNYINLQSSKSTIFISIIINKKESEIMKFSHLNNPFSPILLFATNLQGETAAFSVHDIQSIKITPKIGGVIKQQDKQNLAQMGITFDDGGFIHIPSEKFDYKVTISGDQYTIDITPVGSTNKTATIDAKQPSEDLFCIVNWQEEERSDSQVIYPPSDGK
jgi:hypothetical protein